MPTSIVLEPADGNISEIYSQRHMTAIVLPEEADQTITWISENPEIADIVETYDNKARIMGYAPGTVTIKATTVNGLEATALIHCIW